MKKPSPRFHAVFYLALAIAFLYIGIIDESLVFISSAIILSLVVYYWIKKG